MATLNYKILPARRKSSGKLGIYISLTHKKEVRYISTEFEIDDDSQFENGRVCYRKDAAIWAYRETNRLSTIDWNKTRKLLEDEVMALEAKMFRSGASVEAEAAKLIEEGKVEEAQELLTRHTNDFASLTMQRWEELKEKLWMIFVRSM